MSEDVSKDPVVIARQMGCKHTFIPNHGRQICPHCGVTKGAWEQLCTQNAFNPYAGPRP